MKQGDFSRAGLHPFFCFALSRVGESKKGSIPLEVEFPRDLEGKGAWTDVVQAGGSVPARTGGGDAFKGQVAARGGRDSRTK